MEIRISVVSRRSITGTNREDYAYDTNGRIDLIQRDGKMLGLDHNVYDRLTAVKNLTSATTINYVRITKNGGVADIGYESIRPSS